MAGEASNSTPLAQTPEVATAMRGRRRLYSTGAEVSAKAEGGAVAVDAGDSAGVYEPQGLPLNWSMLWWASGAAAVAFGFFYIANLSDMVNKWSNDSGWSHGFIVPFIALFIVRIKWDTLRLLVPSGSWVGLGVLLVGICGHVLFRATGISHMSLLSMLVVLYGAVLFVFGWEHLKILWLPISYLAFAMPPPDAWYVMLTTPMQTIAAELGVQLLPLFGGQGVRTGTVIHVMYGAVDVPLNVEQACSGMKMLVGFFALAVALGYTTSRAMWQKVIIALMALPIAILCNGLRVTLTGVMAAKVGGQWAEGKAHEYFGMLMYIPALLMLMGVAWVLDRIFVDVPDSAGGGA